MHTISKYFYHKWIDSPDKWYPILSVLYLTNACDFRCPYCSDGSSKPYYTLSQGILPGTHMISLIKAIRRYTDSIVLTGGEPLDYPDLSPVLKNLRSLKFSNVVFTTNGYKLETHLPEIAESITTLAISLDTLDHKKADSCYGIGHGTLSKIANNIDLAIKYKKRKYKMLISSVATPENIADLYDVYYFAQTQGLSFAACPQLVGVKAHELLNNNKHYADFFNFLIHEKRSGKDIHGTVKYLEYIRDLRKFDCHPFTMLAVSPTGDIFYPCLEIGKFAGNLLKENGNLHSIRIQAEKRYGPKPECGNQCHSACALGFSILLKYPSVLSQEAYLLAKGGIRKFLQRLSP